MTAKDDLIVIGVVGIGLLGGVYLVTKGVGDLVPDVGKWFENVASTFKLPDLSDTFGTLDIPEIPKIDPEGVLQDWYDDAIDQINDLNQQIGDLKNEALNTVKTGDGAVMTVSTGITNLGGSLEEMIEKSAAAKETISTIIENAGGVVSSGTEEAAKIIEQIKKIKVWQVPGWMPVGEV